MTSDGGAMRGFAIRPEKIRISREPPADAGINSAKGEMWDIAYLGDMTVFYRQAGQRPDRQGIAAECITRGWKIRSAMTKRSGSHSTATPASCLRD